MPAVPAFRYRAFLSYSHRDEPWARWLHKALEGYVVPRRLVGRCTPFGPVPRRLAPIFRDSDELATAGDLGGKVNEALAESASLLVVCSPSAATSHWVNEEVAAFRKLGRGERICCLIVSGEPNASLVPGKEAEECFAPALRTRWRKDGALEEETVEPVAADVRPGKDTRAEAKCRIVAGMLGLDLDVLKRRDYQRRARRAMIFSAVALFVTAITGALAVAALVARDAAQRRQKEAEDLVAFMLGDLNDKLAQVSRLDIMAAVDDKAMAYFQARSDEDLGDRALAQRVKALEKIGSVRLDQGQLAAAMTSYQAALAIAAKLAATTPDAAHHLAHAEVETLVGLVYWRQGKLIEAQATFASAKSILERAAGYAPADLEIAFQLALIDNNIGYVLEAQGRLDEADAQYRRMLRSMQRLVAAQPGNAEWSESLGSAYSNLGKLALLRGDLAEAMRKYAEDERIQVRLAAEAPKDANRLGRLLTAHAILGRTQALVGDPASGMERLQRAVDIATSLTAMDASNAEAQEQVALYGTQLARLRRLDGDLLAASRLTTKAEAIFARLTGMDAENATWRREYAETLTEHAAQLRAVDDRAGARRQAAAASRMLAPLFAKAPDDRSLLLATAAGWLAQADAEVDGSVARALREKALAAMATTRSGETDPRLLALRTQALLALGRDAEAASSIGRLWDDGYRDAALLASLRDHGIDYPPNEGFRHQLMAAEGEVATDR
ncbi:toll/interleukin-1 receptor domain-containing protein [Luteibacter yeojuensis]|uniref:Toll/interleukin-1 receptor domain-containing protein n=1 Tax=Luteibacter yeojuensis TaxID=345309 RepID=A0A7X5TRB3_9GAMM|nr:toll/interleukin-1 receptor domain-containing protein [Luteibacter yeojuensis]